MMLLMLVMISLVGNVLPYRFGNGLYNQPSRPRKLDAQYWIETLGLTRNILGGYFAEIYRSDETISNLPERYGGGNRTLGTSIYYLLEANEVSIFRVLQSDELWHFYFGRPITVYLINPENGNLEVFNLGPREDHYFFVLVPRGHFYAARVENPARGGYSLVGATVIPGFDFNDIAIPSRGELLERFPQHRELIEELTRIQS